MDNATNKICKASSLGVFFLDAPSTMANHLIQKAFALLAGNPDHKIIRKDGGAAGNGASIAAALPDYRGRFPGDGAFVHRCRALNDLPIGGDLLPGPGR